MRIAIVGTGISGLTVAHYLAPRHDLTLFEAGDHVGGHANTIELACAEGTFALDTGFVVCNDRTYPNFLKLLARLGITPQPSDMSFSVRVDRLNLEYNGSSLGQIFLQKRNLFRLDFWRMLKDAMRFNREAVKLLDPPRPRYSGGEGTGVRGLEQTETSDFRKGPSPPSPPGAPEGERAERFDEGPSLGEYLDAEGYGRPFRDWYLMPMGAAIWSSSPQQMFEFPARYFISFCQNHGLLSWNDRPQWMTIPGGSKTYVNKLIEPIRSRIRRQAVQAIRRDADGVWVDGEKFDQVVVAVHGDEVLPILQNPDGREREVFEAFRYQENDIVLHTDTSILPKNRRGWASWNYHVFDDAPGRATLTYNLNHLHGLNARTVFCETLNAAERIDPAKILRRMTYHHPLYTRGVLASQARWAEVSGKSGVHYCGAYWGHGFHEDGVVSGLRVVRAIDPGAA